MNLEISAHERKMIVGNILTALEIIPEARFGGLGNALDSMDNIDASSLRKTTGLSGEGLDCMLFLFDNQKVPRDVLTLALDSAIAASLQSRKNIEAVDLSWTGPVQFSVEGRSNVSVIEEMINRATRRITVVGYSITGEARNIVRLLIEAMRRNVDVMFVIHSDEESENIKMIKGLWGFHKKPKIFTRRPGDKDAYFKIHAKMVVVDSTDMLVTSANLTWHGMSNNFEVGLRVRGKTAESGQNLIDELVRQKYLRREPW